MHTLNKLSTSKGNYHSDHDDMLNLEDTLRKFLELDEVICTYGQVSFKLNSFLKLIENLKKSLSHPMFSFFRYIKTRFKIDVENAFNQYFASNHNTNSYELRMSDENQSLIFLNDLCGSLSDSDIQQVILSSTASSYETNIDFPNEILKKCSGILQNC